MKVQSELAADEVKQLQGCINDLISLLALPAVWSGGDPSQVLQTLLDALMRMLRLDLIAVKLTDAVGEAPIEIVRLGERRTPMLSAHEICEALSQWSGSESRKWPPLLRDVMGEGDVSIVPLPLGLQGELGEIVAAAERTDFPRQTEMLLLSVAANQASIGLQEARMLKQQKRVAIELDQRVAQRTAELAAANEELRLSENNLRQTVNNIPGLICTMSPAGEIEQLNRPILEYFGKTAGELKGWKMTDAVHPDDLPQVIEAFTDSITNGTPYEVEHRCRRVDGVYRWFQVRGLPVHDANGKITGWYFLLNDVDDRRRAEEKLRHSEALLAEVQSVSLTGGFSWCVDKDDFTFSEEAYRIFEFEKDTQVTLRQIASRVHLEDVPLLSENMARAVNGEVDLDFELRLRMPDGSVKNVHTISHGARDGEGRVEHIGAIQDITRRRQSEEALGKARSELAHVSRITSLGALTASIAHEVNQPLSGIITNASTCLRMLAADTPNVDGARETARRTIRDGNRMSEIITRLRSLFSRKEPATEAVDMNEAVLEVIAVTLPELQKTRVILRRELADDLPLVTGDRVQIQQVILNLLRNASDAMSSVDDRPRDLLVRTEAEDDQIRFSVRDAGAGFETQAAERLFEAFYTTKNEGMGIGLSVSRTIIERHQGRLWATPNSGPGVTFSFSIPCKSADLSDDGRRDGKLPSGSDAA